MKSTSERRNVTGQAILRWWLVANPKITQEDMVGRLAHQGIGLNQSQVAKIEHGARPVHDYEVVAIAKALKVPIQALFG